MNHVEIEQRIDDAYRCFGFRESWRLWYHPRAWAEQGRPLVLCINPAAGGNWSRHGRYSQEAGSAYRIEDWGPRSVVKDPIPKYARMAGLDITDVAYANWVPFRSSSEKELNACGRTLRDWCHELWCDLLSEMRPKCILCIGTRPRDGLLKVGKQLGWGLQQAAHRQGKFKGAPYTFRIDRSPERTVVSVPYPGSRLPLLTEPGLLEPLTNYMKAFAAGVRR